MLETIGRNLGMRLRFGQSIDMLGNLLALFALRQIGKMTQMCGSNRMGSLNDEVHGFNQGCKNNRTLFRLAVIIRHFARVFPLGKRLKRTEAVNCRKFFSACGGSSMKILASCFAIFAAMLTVSTAEARQTINGCEIKRRASCPGVNLSGMDLTRSNLSNANLSGADLSGANLSGDRITEANLTKANLSGANLSGTILSTSYMNNVNLSRADLTKADLSQSTLPDANLREANLGGANLSLTNLKGADLTGANARGAVFIMSSLVNANLTRADLTEATLVGADMRNAILEGTKFCRTAMPDRSINNSGCAK